MAGLARAAERRHAHGQLAAALSDDPERRAWHLANAVVGPDEQVAASLEEAAYRLLRRGDPVGAVTALTKADSLLAESLPLGDQHGYRLFVWCAQYGQALPAARGDDACVRSLTDEIARWAVPRGVLVVPSIAATPRHWPRSDAARSTRHTTKRP